MEGVLGYKKRNFVIQRVICKKIKRKREGKYCKKVCNNSFYFYIQPTNETTTKVIIRNYNKRRLLI